MNESLKELAVRYFEGPIAPEEECELFGFLAASPENAALMREWEREWKQRHVPSADVLRSLARLNGKIERRENRIRARRRWLRFSAAAAVLILISAFTTRHLIHTEAPVQMFSVQAPQGTNSRISLPDGSQVWLNAGSTLNYRSDFNRSSRDIGLSGEAYFEVARNADLPFRVQARGCTFTVLGTRFNISAYDEDPDVLAALMEGSLQFESSRSTETMVPGDLITYDCRTMEASRRQVDTDQFRSWIDGIIRYDAISLPALLRRLAREYDVKIELCTDAFDDKTFRISLTEAQDIESIMGGLCASCRSASGATPAVTASTAAPEKPNPEKTSFQTNLNLKTYACKSPIQEDCSVDPVPAADSRPQRANRHQSLPERSAENGAGRGGAANRLLDPLRKRGRRRQQAGHGNVQGRDASDRARHGARQIAALYRQRGGGNWSPSPAARRSPPRRPRTGR